MKIIRGNLKGRNILSPTGIRPVSVTVRKACFDILQEAIKRGKVLDLFAGSGSLGLEALSNGAAQVTFIDSLGESIEIITKNILSLGLGQQAQAYLKDAHRAITDFFSQGKTFDLIFLDPPYHKGMARITLQTLAEYDILTPSGYIIAFCYTKDDFIKESSKFCLIAEKKYGQTLLLIYSKK